MDVVDIAAAAAGGPASFLGGAAFRWLAGSFVSYFEKRQEHQQEIERLRLEQEQAKERNAWQREAAREAAAAGIELVRVKGAADERAADGAALLATIQGINEASGRPGFVGAWNASIRPGLATTSVFLLVAESVAPGAVTLSSTTREVICAALGVFVGERIRRAGS